MGDLLEQATDMSQSHRTDQGNSEEAGHFFFMILESESQSHRTDQGNSEDKDGHLGRIRSLPVAIPPY